MSESLQWQKDILHGLSTAAEALVPEVDPKRHDAVPSLTGAYMRRAKAVGDIIDSLLKALEDHPKPIRDPNVE